MVEESELEPSFPHGQSPRVTWVHVKQTDLASDPGSDIYPIALSQALFFFNSDTWFYYLKNGDKKPHRLLWD